jgi:hypothetical protein
MKFLDLNTGYSFDGLWTENQSKGYIFWFPAEQSINITYSTPICLLTETEDPLTLTIEDNNIFKFPEFKNPTCDVDGYSFDGELKDWDDLSLSVKTVPEKINDNCFVHAVNVLCKSDIEGEFICKITIDGVGYIRVGADFYGEYEPTKINLENFGVEIPDTVQKAIYDSNVHEDFADNILLNRKFKELMSNYWDIIANKGSYKSLQTSLDWFEWGDSLNVREIWKRHEADKFVFDDREIITILKDKIEDTFENALKTTYISLYYSRYGETGVYDSEGNPEIEEIAMKWSIDDMRLKIALLAQFFGTFFLPIHLSILHATIEDKVFTNTIKAFNGTHTSRYDAIGDFNYVECNVKEGDVFKLGNVNTCVTNDTMYGYWDPENPSIKFGVDYFPATGTVAIDHFNKHYYSGTGVVVPIHLTIPDQVNRDFIKQTIVDIDNNRLYFYNHIFARRKAINIKFNFLALEARPYNIKMTFLLASGKTVTKAIDFVVEDADNITLNTYKVQAKDDSKGLTYDDFIDPENDFMFKIQRQDKTKFGYYYQYLPYMSPENKNFKSYKGIKLSRTVVIETKNFTKYDLVNVRNWFKNYLEFQRKDGDTLKYLVFVSKYFYEPIPEHVYKHPEYKIIRNDLSFYPQFHKLVKMSGYVEDNYTVSQYEAVCCAQQISVTDKNVIPLRYGNDITECEWIFTNSSNADITYHPVSSRKPFVVKDDGLIKPGYYDICFNYSLANGVKNTCKLNSAFRIKCI